MSDFKAKKASNLISAGAPPQTQLWELAALPRPPVDPIPAIGLPSGPRNNLPPQICILKSAYDYENVWVKRIDMQLTACDCWGCDEAGRN